MTTDMNQLIREQARLIILKALRDQTDERLDRVDWSNRRQTPANDQRSAINWRRTA